MKKITNPFSELNALTEILDAFADIITLHTDPEIPGVYAELPDGLRLIFRDGAYKGHYDPMLGEALG